MSIHDTLPAQARFYGEIEIHLKMSNNQNIWEFIYTVRNSSQSHFFLHFFHSPVNTLARFLLAILGSLTSLHLY